MNSPQNVQIDLNSVKNLESQRRVAGWIPTQLTLPGKILLGLTSTLLIGGLCAAVITPLVIAATSSYEHTSTTIVTNVPTVNTTLSTVTSVTTTSTTSSTATTTTTTPSYPVSCFAIVTASNFGSSAGTPTQQGDGLVDRPNISNGTYFNSGGYPPQYVQLELAGFYNITKICLLIAQSPSGQTNHQISVGSISTSLQIITNLTSITSSNQWLNFTYNPILTNVKFIRLTTTISPSWVAWVKFTVYNY